nr:MGMT family protein [Pleurocapsa sp. CCALA 161]
MHCHRVIRASGELGGYRWGKERKTIILGREASRTSCDREDILVNFVINITFL